MRSRHALKLLIACFLPGAAGCPRNIDFPHVDAGREVNETVDMGVWGWEDWEYEAYEEEWEEGQEPPVSCVETDLVIQPLGGCGMFETGARGTCIASSAAAISVRFVTGSSCVGEVACRQGPDSQARFHGHEPGETTLHHIVLRDLPQNASVTCDVLCRCPDGGSGKLLAGGVAVFIAVDQGVRITEVLIDPLGREPDQEFVEIINVSGLPLDIGGWRLADSPPPLCEGVEGCVVDLEGYGDLIPEGTVLRHMEPVILVAEGYMQSDPTDSRPPEGCGIIRLDESLGERGLRNSGGEPVFIVAPDGAAASFYPNALGTPTPGVSVGRFSLDWPDGDVLGWAENAGGAASPCVVDL